MLKIYLETLVCTDNVRQHSVHTENVQEKGYFEILVFLTMLFVHPFVHTRGHECITQVDVKPVRRKIYNISEKKNLSQVNMIQYKRNRASRAEICEKEQS